MKLVARFFLALAHLCRGIARFFAADRAPEVARKTPKTDSKLREEDAARFRRLLWEGERDDVRSFEQPYRANYELVAGAERIRRTNLARSPRSRADEPVLVEEWVPFLKGVSS